MLDLKGRTVLIFGGGEVGARKAAFFRHEADVTVVSRSFSHEIERMPVRRIQADLAAASDDALRALLAGVFLAVAATPDPALNTRIGEICRSIGVFFNNAAGEQGDVLIPSVIRGEHYVVAISTFGMSPAVPRYLRLMLEREYAELDGMIELQAELRALLQESEPSPKRRAAILRDVVCDADVWAALASDREKARLIAEERYLHA